MNKYIDKLAKLSAKDLQKKVVDLRSEITDLRRGIKTGDVQNTQAAKLHRKELARVFTLIARPKVEEPAKEEIIKKAVKIATKEKK